MSLPYGSKVDEFEIVHEGNVDDVEFKRLVSVEPEFYHRSTSVNEWTKILKTSIDTNKGIYKEIYDLTIVNSGSSGAVDTDYFKLYFRITYSGSGSVNLSTSVNTLGNRTTIPDIYVLKTVNGTINTYEIYVKARDGGTTFAVRPNNLYPHNIRERLRPELVVYPDATFQTLKTNASVSTLVSLPTTTTKTIYTIQVYYDGTNWACTYLTGGSGDASAKFGLPIWDADGVRFPDGSFGLSSAVKFVSVIPRYVSSTVLAYTPTFNYNSWGLLKKIAFFNISTGQRVTTLSTQMSVYLIVEVTE